jgi:hypothetical protein
MPLHKEGQLHRRLLQHTSWDLPVSGRYQRKVKTKPRRSGFLNMVLLADFISSDHDPVAISVSGMNGFKSSSLVFQLVSAIA